MAPPRRAERSRADRAMPKARGPDGRARERCLPGRPPVPTPARAIGSPPRRPRHAAARESAPRYAAARSADTGSLLLLYYGANAESASERALVLRVRNVSRAGGAAHGAAAGLPVTVAMPEDTPRAFVEECRHYGADTHLVRGTISDAGKWLAGHGPREAFDVSTLKEPYRVEGKKTMAYELFEQMQGTLPDAIVYPTGGGTGLIGMWKAFDEMQAIGWIGPERPRLVSVQAEGCAPVVRGFLSGTEQTEPWLSPRTEAYGLRLPNPIGGFICLRALRETRGTALAVSETRIGPAAQGLRRRRGT